MFVCTKLLKHIQKLEKHVWKHPPFYFLQNHIAVGRMLHTIESHSATTVPHNSQLTKAFYHFSALRRYSYSYFCYRCGHHPSVVIADTNWKVAFELPGENWHKMYFKSSSIIYPALTCYNVISPFLPHNYQFIFWNVQKNITTHPRKQRSAWQQGGRIWRRKL